jgi:Family of unknown function (DUF6064)
MTLPFTDDQFFGVFEIYNRAIWPAQIVAYMLGALAIGFVFSRTPYRDRVISAVLAIFWLWMGIAYHWAYFSAINRAAYVFGIMFVLQGLLFAWFGAIKGKPSFTLQNNFSGWAGGLLILYATAVYPLIGGTLGHGYPKSPMFGVAPCPTTIFTLGLFLWASAAVPWTLIVIPILWAVIGFTAAFMLGVKEDFGLLVAGVLGLNLMAVNRRRQDIQ